MTFKSAWEKTDQHVTLDKNIISSMVKKALPAQQLKAYEIISGGCANLNIKISLMRDQRPYILRVYLRDPDASYREQKLGVLLKQMLPIPQVYYIGDFDGYRFAMVEHLKGITLRELLLGKESYDLEALLHEAGHFLAKIQSVQFSAIGFFDNDLNILNPMTQEGYVEFVLECINHPTVIKCLDKQDITKIAHYFKQYRQLLPNEHETHLVHADYDPANILVDKIDDQWKITGILDWEFAFSGSPLCDVANMLRYAHYFPPQFENSFLHGLSESYILPMYWRISTHLLNLLSLLDCLVRCPIDQRPNQCADILELIHHIILQLGNTK